MTLIAAEKRMWLAETRIAQEAQTDADINERYQRGEGRIVVENNREKLPGFVDQLKKSDYMDLRPFYQRRPRWDAERQSRLIESFIINVPVPPIFLYEKNFNSYEVMDGQQRITAVRDFYENKFALKGLQHWPELNGRYYHNLPSLVKSGIDRRSISSIVMLKESAPQDEEAFLLRQIVFERLNTGGVELERQEIRNALYQGELNELLLKLSRHPIIRGAWGLPEHHPDELRSGDRALLSSNFFQKMEDAELVLRFFALRNAEHYRRGMQGFLDLYMMKAAEFSHDDIMALENLFLKTIDVVHEVFGENVFRPYDTVKNSWAKLPQKAFFDAVMIGTSHHISDAERIKQKKRVIIEKTKDLFRIHEEGTFTGRANTKGDVQNRINLFSNMIASVLD
ncbi:DUF262 domain-containing protein [Azospirillum brasilense]|uniref:DUF262 domain-containing protein n=1 Tax=Azospirillum brasilense TaxID=192 RepID=UPI000E0B8FB4|nr:DUF262 domain-containing protein [Azospirillum brasilense]